MKDAPQSLRLPMSLYRSSSREPHLLDVKPEQEQEQEQEREREQGQEQEQQGQVLPAQVHQESAQPSLGVGASVMSGFLRLRWVQFVGLRHPGRRLSTSSHRQLHG
jgi:hypothetical protein